MTARTAGIDRNKEITALSPYVYSRKRISDISVTIVSSTNSRGSFSQDVEKEDPRRNRLIQMYLEKRP